MRITSQSLRWVCLLVVIAGGTLQGSGRTPTLIEAVKAGNESVARAALRQGADVNQTDADGATALHWAVYRGLSGVVDALLRAGAAVSAKNLYGVTPLALACERGDTGVVQRLLLAGADPNATRAGGETVLMTAARTGNAEIVRALVMRGADVHRRTTHRGQTALMAAATRGNVEAVRALLEAGARVADRAYESNMAFLGSPNTFGARTTGTTDLTERFDSYTSLLFAVRGGHIPAVIALLDDGADVNDRGPSDVPALSIAAINAHWELAAVLLDRGANPNASDANGSVLHHIARTRGSIRTIRNSLLPPPPTTGSLTSIELVKKLIAKGADVNARMPRGDLPDATPLLIAAKPADPELISVLVANGADPLARSADGTTLLMQAAGMGQFANVGDDEEALAVSKLALQWGADVNATNSMGNTALHAAAFRGYNPLVELLVDHGARLDVKNTRGQIPLLVAHAEFRINVLHRRPETVALLTRVMQSKGIEVPPLPSVDEVRAMFVEKGPSITCPTPPTVASSDGKPVRVSYDDATVTEGGDGGTRTSCTPLSGSEFAVGANTVACRAVDIIGRTDSCAFIVRVMGPAGAN